MSTQDSWKIIHDWLSKKQPSMISLLNPPATLDDFRQLEEIIGYPLPDNFKELYLIHNGSDPDSGILVGLPLMSLEEMLNTWKIWVDIVDDGGTVEDISNECHSHPHGHVKPLYANRGWLPFAGDTQNYVAIDFDPDKNGKVGQIINSGRDDMIRHVIADNFGDFLQFVAWLFTSDQVVPEQDDPPRWLRVKDKNKDLLTGLPELLSAYSVYKMHQ